MAYRLAHGLIEVLQLFSVRSPIKGSTDVGAAQPKFDVIPFIDRGFLAEGWPEARRRRRKRTLIIVSRALAEPKTAPAGVMLESSFARFRATMAASNFEKTPFRPFCWAEFIAISKIAVAIRKLWGD